MLNKKNILYSLVISSLCFVNNAFAMSEEISDPLSVGIAVKAPNRSIDSIYDNARDKALLQVTVKIADHLADFLYDNYHEKTYHTLKATNKSSSDEKRRELQEISKAFAKERHSYFGLRLVSSLWKSAVEDSIVRKEVMNCTLAPNNSEDSFLKDLNYLITGLTFYKWSEEHGDQITKIFSTNTFNNLVALQLESTAQFDLSEILDKCPKVSRLFLMGTLVPSPFRSFGGSKVFRVFEGNPQIVQILERLETKHPKNLRQLSLQGNDLQDNFMGYLWKKGQEGYFKELESLDLSYNQFSPLSLDTIRTLLSAGALPALKTLDLSYNYLKSYIDDCKQLERDDGWLVPERIIEDIVQKFPGLTTIRVVGCDLYECFLKKCNERNGNKIQYNKKSAQESALAELLKLSPKIVARDGEES